VRAAGARSARVVHADLLDGGAVQQNWALDVDFSGGRHDGGRALVLRVNFQTKLPASRSKAHEFAVLRRVHAHGVLAPEPLFLCEDASVLGEPFFVMRRLPGSAARASLIAAAARDGFGDALAAALAAQLATIHAFDAGPNTPPDAARALIAEYRTWLAMESAPGDILPVALDWLDRNTPGRPASRLVHRDFRTGNFMVEGGRLAGILDWEFAGPGDPAEDIGWLCARCWRGGADERETGGLATRDTFISAYAAAGGELVDRDLVAFWEIMAHVRWALIARQQARRAAAGDSPQHELVEAAGRIAGLDADIAAMIA
jgi:aminoglycoside phosphotransferase (APT) family kinase protein